MTLQEIYFYHERLNSTLFKSELGPLIINPYPIGDQDHDLYMGTLDNGCNAMMLYIDSKDLEEAKNNDDKLYYITLLLHVMVHQSNWQNGIIDRDPDTGEDMPGFVFMANRFGFADDGYNLKPEEAEAFKSMLIDTYDEYIETLKPQIEESIIEKREGGDFLSWRRTNRKHRKE